MLCFNSPLSPQTLACARGHTETAIILYKWNQNALNVRNNAQKGPVEVARDYGHGELARELERQEKERLSQQQRTPTSASIPTLASITSSTTASSGTHSSASSASPNALPTSCSNHSSSASSPSASPAQASQDLLSNLNESNSSSSNGSNSSSNSSTADCKAPDGNNNLQSGGMSSDLHSLTNDASGTMHNFLNLNQIFSYGEGLHGANSDSCSNDNFGLVAAFNPSLSPTGLSPYSEMKGSCSSTGSQGGGGLHYGLENTNSNPMLSNALSPNSDSNRSHDGVFLRPGAVYSRYVFEC